MREAIKCTLQVNNRWGYRYAPIECSSINEAYKKGQNYVGGFAFSVIANGVVVRRGFCKAA